MQFVIIGKDGTDEKAKDRRLAARPAHIALGDKLRKLGNMWYTSACYLMRIFCTIHTS